MRPNNAGFGVINHQEFYDVVLHEYDAKHRVIDTPKNECNSVKCVTERSAQFCRLGIVPRPTS